MKGFHNNSGGKQAGQKHYTPNIPCFCLRYERGSWRLTPVVGICKATREVSVSPLGLRSGNRGVESVFLCVSSECGWMEGFRYSLRRSSIILKQETGWRYAVFTCKGVLLIIRDEKEPKVWRQSFVLNCWQQQWRAEVAFQWPSDDSHQKLKQFLDTVTVIFIRMGIGTEDSDERLPRGRSIPHIRSDIPLKV